MDKLIRFRARGKYTETKCDSWVTTGWRATREEAETDVRCYGEGRYTNLRVIEQEQTNTVLTLC